MPKDKKVARETPRKPAPKKPATVPVMTNRRKAIIKQHFLD